MVEAWYGQLDPNRKSRPTPHAVIAEHVLYINFLERYGLKPWEVDELDPDFVEVLQAKMEAENLLAKHERDRKNGSGRT